MSKLSETTDAVKTGVTVVILGGLGYGAYKIYKLIESLQTNPQNHPALAGTLQYWGLLKVPAGAQIQNITGDNSANAAGQAILTADAGPHTKYAFDQALSKFSIAHGFANGDEASQSNAWPFAPVGTPSDFGFADWQSQGYPDLTTIH